jgi:hypothetical protein
VNLNSRSKNNIAIIGDGTGASVSTLILIAFLCTILQAYHGIQYSDDSRIYILFSQILSDNFDFDKPEAYAPLYIWTLALLKLFGFGTVAAIYCTWFSYYLIIAFSFSLISRDSLLSGIGLIFVFSNMATGVLYRYVWTELGYAALLSIACAALYTSVNLKSEKMCRLFLLALALIPLQRYIGAFVAMYLSLIYLLTQQGLANRLHASKKLFLIFTPAAVIYSWNFLSSGDISGPRIGVTTSYRLVIDQARSVIFEDFLVEWAIWLVLSTLIFVRMFSSCDSGRDRIILTILLMMTPLVQIAAQIYSNSTVAIDQMNPRYLIILTPIFYFSLLISSRIISPSNRFILVALVAAIGIVANIYFADRSRFNFFSRSFDLDLVKTRTALGYLEPSRVGVYFDKAGFQSMSNFMASDYILAGRILPNRMCKKYIARGDYRLMEPYVYLPNCQIFPGHTYEMILDEQASGKYDALLVYKDRLSRDWLDNLNITVGDYEITDLGPFYLAKIFPRHVKQ